MEKKKKWEGSSFARSLPFSSSLYHHFPIITILFFSFLYLVWIRWLQNELQQLSCFPSFLFPSRNKHLSQAERQDEYFRLGLIAAGILFLGFGGIHFPTSFFIHPHPSVWRLILAVGLVYTLFLFFLLFQHWETPRRVMQWYDPRTAILFKRRDCATDCRLFTSDSWFHFTQELDIFVAAHFLGYVGKALVLRDWRVVTCVSLGFELVEVTLQHIFPNFRECWWDHLLLDVLLCNGGGTVCGMYLLRWLSARKYHFFSRQVIICESVADSEKKRRKKREKRSSSKAKSKKGESNDGAETKRDFFSAASKGAKEDAKLCHWNVFVSSKCFIWVFSLVGLVLLEDFNVFLIMTNLNLPPSYSLVSARLVMFGLLGFPAVREYYEFFSNPKVTTLGPFACILIASVLLEAVVFGRMTANSSHFQEVMPTHIIIPWIFVMCCFAIWFFLFFWILHPSERHGGVKHGKPSLKCAEKAIFPMTSGPVRRWAQKLSTVADFFFYLSFVGMAGLFIMGMPDLQWGRKTFEEFISPYISYIVVWRSESSGLPC